MYATSKLSKEGSNVKGTHLYSAYWLIESPTAAVLRERIKITAKLWQHLAKVGWSFHHLWQPEVSDFFGGSLDKSHEEAAALSVS